ncbi:MAG: tetraacyldisaccharide 4'-kinase [Candidatus Aminicenantia bacterium]
MKIIYKLLSMPFQIFNLILNFFYKNKIKKGFKVSAPVISVGNISFGGEGKTTIAISIGKFFLSQGIKPSVILRGYKGKKESKGGVVCDGKKLLLDWKDVGDEAVLISENLKESIVIIGKNRISSSLRAIEMGASVIILDDGFQYRKLHRDLDIVILSETQSFKREFLYSISRADAILLNSDFYNERIIKKVKRIRKEIPIFEFKIKNIGIFDEYGCEVDMKEKKSIAYCAIANPSRFIRSLEFLSIKTEKIFIYPDHHELTLKDKKKIEEYAKKTGADYIITTEKDFVKARGHIFSIPLIYLKIEAWIEENFYRYMIERLKLWKKQDTF